jgi:HEAT repeat protein
MKAFAAFLVFVCAVAALVGAAVQAAPPPITSETVAASVPPQLAQLWTQLDNLRLNKQDLAWSRWQALSVGEKARVIARRTSPQAPPPGWQEKLAALTADEAQAIVDRYERGGPTEERQLAAFALDLITADESAAFEQRRLAIVRDIAGLGAEAVPALVVEILNVGPHSSEAQMALGQMGPPATPALLEALKGAQAWQQRTPLLRALGATEDPRARDVLLRALDDPDIEVRRAALEALKKFGTVPPNVYVRCLHDEDCVVRSGAISALEDVGDAAAIPALLEVARYDVDEGKDGSLWMRRDARRVIGEIAKRTGAHVNLPPDTPRLTFDDLAAAAACNNRGIRQDAVGGLRWFREKRTVTLLQEVVRRDPDARVRAEAVSALGSLFLARSPEEPLALSRPEREEVSNFLLDLTREQGEVGVNAFEATRFLWWENAAAFRRLPELFAVGVGWIEGNDLERQMSALYLVSSLGQRAPEVLSELATPHVRARLLPHLVAGMDDEKVGRRIRFTEALGYLRERSVVPRLIELLADKEWVVREFAINALGRIGDDRALPALEKIAASQSQDTEQWPLSTYAREAIDEIHKASAAGKP